MKVELWYDPVFTETGIRLNGYWQERQDIYSFLYSVRCYPLQTWLEPDGSWTGLRQQMLDISRGEEIELVFHGREVDFGDVAHALQGTDAIHLTYCLWDSENVYLGQAGEADALLKAVSFHAPSSLRLDTELDPKPYGTEAWYFAAETEDDLLQAERAEELCVFVKESLLDSYDRLPRMEKLTRSLHRPAQAVCCCVRDGERRREFERYAAQFTRYGFTFTGGDTPPEFLYEKYGRPYLVRKAQERYLAVGDRMDQIVAGFSGEELDIRIQELVYREQQCALNQEEQRKLAEAQAAKEWLSCNKNAGEKYRRLVDFRAVSQCEEEEHE